MNRYPQWPQWPKNRPALIAEVGMNHGGDEGLAWEMIRAAHDSGADFVKIQSFTTSNFFHPSLPYFKKTEGMELAVEKQLSLFKKAADLGIKLITTPFDRESVDMVDEFAPAAYKIASMDNDNYPLIEYIAGKKRPVLLSLGMAEHDEIQRAVDIISASGNEQFVLLHCISDYPTRLEDMQLSTVPGLAQEFARYAGLSDHSMGLFAGFAAAVLGAVVIEKHFTTDRELAKQIPDADHDISIEPSELRVLREFCEKVPQMIGSFPRKLTENEKTGRKDSRRGIYAAREIEAGEALNLENICFLRPVKGLKAGDWLQAKGKRTLKKIEKLSPVISNDLEI